MLNPPAADCGEFTSMHPDTAPPYDSRKWPREIGLSRANQRPSHDVGSGSGMRYGYVDST